jgi:TonB family protein
MNTLFDFLVKSSLSMALFYGLYWFILRKETWFSVSRFYLLATLLLAALLPLFPLHYTVTRAPAEPLVLGPALSAASDYMIVQLSSSSGTGFSFLRMVFMVYLCGVAWVFLRLVFQSLHLFFIALRSNRYLQDQVMIVDNKRFPVPFSFFRYVFIHSSLYQAADLANILAHEKVHIREHHWIDLLTAELLVAVFWFNPFVWWYERSIKQNHEYLADQGVLSEGRNPGRYQALLINQLMGVQVIGFANHLNYAVNATRFNMMTKKKSPSGRAFRMLFVLPLIFGLMVFFAKPVYQMSPPPDNKIQVPPGSDNAPRIIRIDGIIEGQGGIPLHGASVILAGTFTGTITNQDGRFKLEVPKHPGASLHISYVGYETTVIDLSDHDPSLGLSLYVELKKGMFHLDPEKHFKAPQPPPPPPSAPSPPPVKTDTRPSGEVEEVFIVVEKMPEYPGGYYDLGKYMEFAVQEMKKEMNDLSGKALIGFTVDEHGKVSQIRVLESDNRQVAEAALRIIAGMQDWEPARQRGKAVPVDFSLPVQF